MWKLYFDQVLTSADELDRIIAIGDVHGQIDLLKQLVEDKIKFDRIKDALIFLGDYIDRANSPKDEEKVLDYITELANNNPGRIILLRGNHEEMAIQFVRSNTPEAKNRWVMNGCGEKHEWPKEKLWSLCEFSEQLPLFYETKNYVFCHAGAHRNNPLEKQSKSVLLWQRDNLWGYGENKKLVVGHTIVPKVTQTEYAIMLDLGAFKHGKLAGYDIQNDVEYIASRDFFGGFNHSYNS